MKFIIEKATKEDKEFLLDLRKVTISPYLEDANIILSEDENIARVDSFFDNSYVIKDVKENCIWLLKYIENDKVLELIQLQILPEYQNKGIGTDIIRNLILQSQELNKQLILKVLKNNPSITLYQRLWFRKSWEDEIEYQMVF